MSARHPPAAFAARPGAAEAWISGPDRAPERARLAHIHTARLTLDVTPDLRRRIKLAALSRGLTMADLLRELLEGEFPARDSIGGGGT